MEGEGRQRPSVHIGQMTQEFMDFLDSTAGPEDAVMAAVVAVWTESGGVYWRVEPAEDAAERDATIHLALSLAQTALDGEESDGS